MKNASGLQGGRADWGRQMYHSRTFHKMLISITLVCLCFYGIGLFSNQYSRNVLSHQIQDTLDSKVHFWEEQLQQETDSLLLTQSSLTNDASLLKLHVAWDSLSNYQRYEAVKQFSYRLLNVKVLHSIAASIKTYFPDRKIVISADSPILDSYEEDDYGDFKQACLNEDGSICLTIFFPYNMNPSNRKIPHFYIRTTITPKTLQGKLEEMLGEDEGTVFLLNQDGNVLAGSGKKLEEDIASVPVLALVQEKIRTAGEEESIHASRDGFASGRLLSRLGIWLVYCYPNQVVEKPLRFFRIFNAALTILVVALLGAYAFDAGKSFARPLGRILQAMEDKQDKNSFLIQEKGKDELAIIYDKYNRMVLRTESLIRENLDSKYRVHIARLRALQYQIQPHFLYNSIFLIYRMAQMDENEPIADYAEHLGKYYQYITRVSDRKVKISQEIEHIRNYLAIQETRFGGRIRAFLGEVPPELADAKLMPLTLQPLVENAYEHGMKNRVRDGEVHIKMRFEDSIFYFTVEDNGPGMTAEELARVKKRMEEGRIEEEEIHALSNTNIRLKLHYGVNSGLYFENRQEGGFRVTARIQLTEEKYV